MSRLLNGIIFTGHPTKILYVYVISHIRTIYLPAHWAWVDYVKHLLKCTILKFFVLGIYMYFLGELETYKGFISCDIMPCSQLKSINVSEEQWTTGVISQKTGFFINTFVRNSDPTHSILKPIVVGVPRPVLLSSEWYCSIAQETYATMPRYLYNSVTSHQPY
jgi:hypothetical protein